MRDKDLPQTHLTKHLDHRLHGGLVSNLEGGGVHQPPEINGGYRTLEQLLIDSPCGIDEEHPRLPRRAFSSCIYLIC